MFLVINNLIPISISNTIHQYARILNNKLIQVMRVKNSHKIHINVGTCNSSGTFQFRIGTDHINNAKK